MPLPDPLPLLAKAFDDLLSGDEKRRQIAHHAAHVACENWLAMELAMLVNSQTVLELSGWRAVLEKGRVDVTLLPPDSNDVPIFLELKVIDRSYWVGNWADVYEDLAGKPSHSSGGLKKKPAHAAICFMLQPTSPPQGKPQTKTLKMWADSFASVPIVAPNAFVPVPDQRSFLLQYTSPPILLEWEHPVPGRWDHGYSAVLRVLWVTLPESGAVAAHPRH